jgi:hypothetical protein
VTRFIPESELVYEIEGHRPLSDPHLLALHVGHVVISDLLDLSLESPSLLVFLPVLLSLDPEERLKSQNFNKF